MSGWPVSGKRKVQRESERQPWPRQGPCSERRKFGRTVALTRAASEHLSAAALLPERRTGSVALQLVTGRRVEKRCEHNVHTWLNLNVKQVFFLPSCSYTVS